MPLYRLRTRLDLPDGKILERWQVSDLTWLKPKHVDILLERGAVTKVQSPTIAQLGYMFPKPWRGRAVRLQNAGVESVDQLFDVSEQELAADIGVGVQAIRQWKCDAKELLHIEVPNICK